MGLSAYAAGAQTPPSVLPAAANSITTAVQQAKATLSSVDSVLGVPGPVLGASSSKFEHRPLSSQAKAGSLGEGGHNLCSGCFHMQPTRMPVNMLPGALSPKPYLASTNNYEAAAPTAVTVSHGLRQTPTSWCQNCSIALEYLSAAVVQVHNTAAVTVITDRTLPG